MRQEIIQKLYDLNQTFYSRMAGEFASSRSIPWPGWQKLWHYFEEEQYYPDNILDVGCGNGRFLDFVAKKLTGFKYLGIDSSRELLQIAKQKYQSKSVRFEYHDLRNQIKLKDYYELIVIFAVLHHIPGFTNRAEILSSFAGRLIDSTFLVFTEWNIATDQKLSKKILPWYEAGIDEKQLEAGDLLLDWKKSGVHRYYHSFNEEEITELLKLAGLKLKLKYKADGANGDLNTYYVCTR